jgi:hypothetical protein
VPPAPDAPGVPRAPPADIEVVVAGSSGVSGGSGNNDGSGGGGSDSRSKLGEACRYARLGCDRAKAFVLRLLFDHQGWKGAVGAPLRDFNSECVMRMSCVCQPYIIRMS